MSTETLVPYDEALSRYEPVLGIETHIELGTATKMFCGCPTEFGAEPNTQVCPVCLGLPGALPVTNRAAIEGIIKIGLALNFTIAEWSRFELATPGNVAGKPVASENKEVCDGR